MGLIKFIEHYSQFAVWAMGGFLGWIWWSLKNRFATKEDLCLLKTDIDRQNARLNTVERRVLNVPSMQEFHRIQITIEHLAGEQKEQKAILTRLEKGVDRLQEYLMDKEK